MTIESIFEAVVTKLFYYTLTQKKLLKELLLSFHLHFYCRMIVCFGRPSSYTPWTRRLYSKGEPSVNSEWFLQAQEFQRVSSIIVLTALKNSESREVGFAGKETVVFIGDKHYRAKFKVK